MWNEFWFGTKYRKIKGRLKLEYKMHDSKEEFPSRDLAFNFEANY